ncbi:hypothetical protein BCR36DRAFT_586647 [Piromyces finnis]|uniref:Acyltransferase 3 domain-containing protein n=1 Tax=Piromyces finnis TaxID=1754191 RepID=A0A1Y1UZD8_9FUNG|nr:hypothetical protein BCR36DRAFT_586647 [Piromyces finnis]|eukprot:ORX43368.1 hypothetical protein BCR36DRAFT_586647 [Piromyces finnis]
MSLNDNINENENVINMNFENNFDPEDTNHNEKNSNTDYYTANGNDKLENELENSQLEKDKDDDKYLTIDINNEYSESNEEEIIPIIKKKRIVPLRNASKIKMKQYTKLKQHYRGKTQQQKKKTERVYWLDCLRVFASFLVVFIHCSNMVLKPDIDYKTHNGRVLIIYCALTRPCVPLFIMISGMLFLNPQKKNITTETIFKKYIPRIFKCYVFWSLYYGIFDRFIINYEKKEFELGWELIIDTIKTCIISGSTHLWYLNFTIGIYIVTPVYRVVVKDRKMGWYMVALCSIISYLVPTIHEFFNIALNIDLQVFRTYVKNLVINTAGHYLGYYLMGYMVGSHVFVKKKHIFYSYIVGITGCLLSVILRFISCYSLDENAHNLSRYYNFNVAMGAYGIFVFFKYSVNRFLKPLMRVKSFRKILSTLSDCSLGVYLIHLTIYHIFYCFNFHSQLFDPLYWVPIYSIILYTISLFLVYYLKKDSFMAKVL